MNFVKYSLNSEFVSKHVLRLRSTELQLLHGMSTRLDVVLMWLCWWVYGFVWLNGWRIWSHYDFITSDPQRCPLNKWELRKRLSKWEHLSKWELREHLLGKVKWMVMNALLSLCYYASSFFALLTGNPEFPVGHCKISMASGKISMTSVIPPKDA